jgi:hypothetical protein
VIVDEEHAGSLRERHRALLAIVKGGGQSFDDAAPHPVLQGALRSESGPILAARDAPENKGLPDKREKK